MPGKYSHTGKVDLLETKVPTRLGSRHPDTRLTGDASLTFLQFSRKKSKNITRAAAMHLQQHALFFKQGAHNAHEIYE